MALLEVYSAGEEPITGADGRSLSRSIRSRAQVDPVFVEQLDDVVGTLENLIQPGDIVLTQGAGNVGALAIQIKAMLEARGEK